MTTPSPALPDKAELERQQLYLANEKLKIETRKLERDAAPENWWAKAARNIIAIGGLVTVAATAFGIWDSYTKSIADREDARVAEQRTRIEEAIKQIEAPTTIAKLVGLSVLSGYLDSSSKKMHRQILFTLTASVATGTDIQVQAAIINLIDALPKDGAIAQDDWAYFQNLLVTESRALAVKGHLLHRDQSASAALLDDEEIAAQAVGKLIAINARKGVVTGYGNYHGIFCKNCDFRGAVFPDAVDFTEAVLEGADFRGATLKSAVFKNAELTGAKGVSSGS